MPVSVFSTLRLWSCPDTWQFSDLDGLVNPLQRRRQSSLRRARPGRRLPHGSISSGVAHAGPTFPAERNGSEGTSFQDCDPSQPDILQINHDRASVNRISGLPFPADRHHTRRYAAVAVAITPDGLTAPVTSFDERRSIYRPHVEPGDVYASNAGHQSQRHRDHS